MPPMFTRAGSEILQGFMRARSRIPFEFVSLREAESRILLRRAPARTLLRYTDAAGRGKRWPSLRGHV